LPKPLLTVLVGAKACVESVFWRLFGGCWRLLVDPARHAAYTATSGQIACDRGHLRLD
jgi:hypothetical protein